MSLFIYHFIKRFFDLTISFILVVFLMPIYFLLALLVRIDSKGPAFYMPYRTGYKGRNFKIIKFRTMFIGSDLGPGTTSKNDKRITKFGLFLRKSKLDEIPQFFNILKGEMSFVGPRPELPKYTKNYKGNENLILNVKPGITDFSSIKYSDFNKLVDNNDPDNFFEKNILRNKNLLRLKYVKEQSLKTDLSILFNTVFIVIKNQF